MNGISALIKETPGSSLPLPPHEDSASWVWIKGQTFIRHQMCTCLDLGCLPLELWEIINVVQKTLSLWYFCSFFVVLLFNHSVLSDTLWTHGLQHTRPFCPPLSPTVCSNSCPLSWWCHPTISSSVAPLFSCPQSFPASEFFPMS